MQRLDQLERENRNLADEVHALRAEIAGARASAPGPVEEAPVNVSPAPIDERMAVQEQRTAELAQTKVEAAQRMPVTLTGMVSVQLLSKQRSQRGRAGPADGGAVEQCIGRWGWLEPKHHRTALSRSARFGRASAGIARSGFVGRHDELAEPPSPDARGQSSGRLEKQHSDGWAGQTADCTARSGFAGAGGFFAAHRRGQPVVMEPAGALRTTVRDGR